MTYLVYFQATAYCARLTKNKVLIQHPLNDYEDHKLIEAENDEAARNMILTEFGDKKGVRAYKIGDPLTLVDMSALVKQ